MLLQNEGLQSKQHAKLIIQQGTAQRDAGVLHEDIFIFFLNVAKCTTFWQMAPSFCSPCSQTHLGSAQGRTYCDTLGLQNPPLCWSHLCSPPHPQPEPHQAHTLQFYIHIPDPLGHKQADKDVFSRPLLCLPGASESLSVAHAYCTRRKINKSSEENTVYMQVLQEWSGLEETFKI